MFKTNKINLLIFFSILFFVVTYFSKINYQLDDVDELNYLSDSLLLLEGILPSSKHAPSGLSTWVGTGYVFIDFLFQLIINQGLSHIADLIQSFDNIIYKHYQNLTLIKASLFTFNVLLILYLFKIDEKKIFFSFLILFFCSPFYIFIILSGKPFLTAGLFCAISLLLNEKNRKLSLIFFAFALAEKWEYILFINYICFDKKNKFNANDYLIVLLVFFATAPWFTISLIQNLKIQLNFLIWNSNSLSSNLFEKLLIFIPLLFYVISLLFFNFINKNKIKFSLLLVIGLSAMYLVFFKEYYIRWFLPYFVLLAFELSKLNYLNSSKNILILQIVTIIFLIMFNTKNFTSDLEILEFEKNSKYNNIISDGLLIEELNFESYINNKLAFVNTPNIKNINFFQNKDAPIAFSVSGNIERAYIRRHEYLSKYNKESKKNKYILNFTGLKTDPKYWCEHVENKDSTIITFAHKTWIKPFKYNQDEFSLIPERAMQDKTIKTQYYWNCE